LWKLVFRFQTATGEKMSRNHLLDYQNIRRFVLIPAPQYMSIIFIALLMKKFAPFNMLHNMVNEI